MGWVSPTGFNDPSSDWDNEPKAYDDNLGTFARQTGTGASAWSGYLELTHSAIYCDQMRYYFRSVYGDEIIDIDVYDGSWHDAYQGVIGAPGSWRTKTFTVRSITKYRMRIYTDHPENPGYYKWLYETDFGEVYTKSLSGSVTPSGNLTKMTSKTPTGGLTPSGALSKFKTSFKSLAGTITPSGAVTTTKTYVRSFGGTITPAGAIGRTIFKALAGTVTPAGALVKMISKSLAGTLDLAGVVARLWLPVKYGYTLEVHNSAGDLISVLKNSLGIRYIRTLNQPHQLLFQLPADDDALDDITLPNEIWLRNARDGTVVRKFKLIRETDRRT